MKTSKINRTVLFIFLFCCAFMTTNAQRYFADSHKGGEHPEDFMSREKVLELEGIATAQKNHLSHTQTIYTSFSAGDVLPIRAYLARKIDWNGQPQFPFASGDPHLSSDVLLATILDKMNEGWSDFKLHEVTYEEKLENIIAVSGRYTATRRQQKVDATFLHVWTWEDGKITSFQHYAPVHSLAKR